MVREGIGYGFNIPFKYIVNDFLAFFQKISLFCTKVPSRPSRNIHILHFLKNLGIVAFHRRHDMDQVRKMCNGLEINGKAIQMEEINNGRSPSRSLSRSNRKKG